MRLARQRGGERGGDVGGGGRWRRADHECVFQRAGVAAVRAVSVSVSCVPSGRSSVTVSVSPTFTVPPTVTERFAGGPAVMAVVIAVLVVPAPAILKPIGRVGRLLVDGGDRAGAGDGEPALPRADIGKLALIDELLEARAPRAIAIHHQVEVSTGFVSVARPEKR